MPTLNLLHPNRLCACSKTGFVPTLNQLLQNRLCACSKTSYVQSLNLLHPNRLCIGIKPAFSCWTNISTVSEVRCDCQGFGLVARIEASILVFDTKQVLYWPVLGRIQFCSFDRKCKTCLDTKPVFYQGRFCSPTHVGRAHLYLHEGTQKNKPLKKLCMPQVNQVPIHFTNSLWIHQWKLVKITFTLNLLQLSDGVDNTYTPR